MISGFRTGMDLSRHRISVFAYIHRVSWMDDVVLYNQPFYSFSKKYDKAFQTDATATVKPRL